MKDCFCVAVCGVSVAFGLKRFSIIGVVIYFAVVNNVEGGVFIRHRLMTARDVDDTQPSVAQSDVAVDENPFVVRTAMGDDVAHGHELGTRNYSSRTARERNAVNAAHNSS